MSQQHCIKCKNVFQKETKIFPHYDKNGLLKGYLCDKCRHEFPQINCIKCGVSLGHVLANGKIQEESNGNLYLYLDVVCPSCNMKQSHKVDPEIHKKNLKEGAAEETNRKSMLQFTEDKDISLIQNYLKQGFQITGNRWNFSQNKDTVEITFEKGNKREENIFENYSPEFSHYVARIHFITDENFRRKLVFIDPNEYWSGSSLPQKIPNSKITISGFEFTDLLFYPIKQSKNQNAQPDYIIFDIDLSKKENFDFRLIDYREKILFFKENILTFSGHIAIVIASFKSFNVYCTGKPRQMATSSVNMSVTGPNETNPDYMKLLMDSFEINSKIQNVHTEDREYEVYIPVEKMEISDELKIGSVEFKLKPTGSDLFLKQMGNKFSIFAKIVLVRNKLYDAISDGFHLLNGAISLINFRIRARRDLRYGRL